MLLPLTDKIFYDKDGCTLRGRLVRTEPTDHPNIYIGYYELNNGDVLPVAGCLPTWEPCSCPRCNPESSDRKGSE